MDVVFLERHAIDLFWFVLILWTRIEGKNPDEGSKAVRSKELLQLFGEDHLQFLPTTFVNKSAVRTKVAVGISNVRLDIVDGGAVHKVSPKHMNDGTFLFGKFYTFNAYRR